MDAYRKAYAIATVWTVDRKDDPQAQETLAGVCFSLAILLADQGDVERLARLLSKIRSDPRSHSRRIDGF